MTDGPGDPEWEKRNAILKGEEPKPEPEGEIGGPTTEDPPEGKPDQPPAADGAGDPDADEGAV
jgi:hypothetical protein